MVDIDDRIKDEMEKLDKKIKYVHSKVDPKIDEATAKVKAEIKPALDKVDTFMDENGKKIAGYVFLGFLAACAVMIGGSLLGIF